MVAPLILAGYIASEAYAKKQRNLASKAEALKNAPKPIIYDKKNKREINYSNFLQATSLKNKPKGMKDNQWAGMVNSQFAEIGTFTPKDNKSNYKPDWMLKDMGIIQPPKVAKKDESMFYYEGNQFMSLGSLYNSFPKADKSKIDQQTVSFSKDGTPSYGEVQFGISKDKSVEGGSVFLDANLLPTDKKNADWLGEQKTVNGKTIYIAKTKMGEAKPTTKTEDAFLFGQTIGTKNELIKKNILNEDTGYFWDGASVVGTRDVEYQDGVPTGKSTFSPFNETLLKKMGVITEKETQETAYKYSVRLLNSAGSIITVPVPEGQDPKTFVTTDYPNLKHMENVRTNLKTNEITYENPDGKTKNSDTKGSANKSLGIPVVSFPAMKTTNDPFGQNRIEFRIPKGKISPDIRKATLLDANLFVGQHLDKFNNNPSKANNFVIGLQKLLLDEFKNLGYADDETEGTNIYKSIDGMMRDFGHLSQLKIKLPEDNLELTFPEYMERLQNNTVTIDMIRQMRVQQNVNPDKKVVGGSVEFKAKGAMAKRLNVPEGTDMKTTIVAAYESDYKEVVEGLLNLGRGNKEKDFHTNMLLTNLTRYKPRQKSTSNNMFGDPEKDQPELNVLKAIYEVRVPQSVKGQIQIKNGLEILRAGLDPDIENNSLALQLSPQIATIANFLNDYYVSQGGDFTKLMNVINSITPTSVNATRAMLVKYGKGRSTKLANDAIDNSRGIVVTGRNAKIEALALRGTYIAPDGSIYPEGSGLAQFYLDVDGALHVGKNLLDAGKRGIRSMLNLDIDIDPKSFALLGEDDQEFLLKLKQGANAKIARFDRLVNKGDANLTDEYIAKENEAKERNDATLDKIIAQMQQNDDIKMKKFAQRNFHKYMLAYQLAAAIQGGTGGRTISDQDVENILNAFNFDIFSKPEHELAAIDAAVRMLDRLISYNDAIANSGPNGKGAFIAIAADRLLQRSDGGGGITNISATTIASEINEIGSGYHKGNKTQANSETATKKEIKSQTTIGDFSFKTGTPANVAYRGYKTSMKAANKADEIMSFEDFENAMKGTQ